MAEAVEQLAAPGDAAWRVIDIDLSTIPDTGAHTAVTREGGGHVLAATLSPDGETLYAWVVHESVSVVRLFVDALGSAGLGLLMLAALWFGVGNARRLWRFRRWAVGEWRCGRCEYLWTTLSHDAACPECGAEEPVRYDGWSSSLRVGRGVVVLSSVGIALALLSWPASWALGDAQPGRSVWAWRVVSPISPGIEGLPAHRLVGYDVLTGRVESMAARPSQVPDLPVNFGTVVTNTHFTAAWHRDVRMVVNDQVIAATVRVDRARSAAPDLDLLVWDRDTGRQSQEQRLIEVADGTGWRFNAAATRVERLRADGDDLMAEAYLLETMQPVMERWTWPPITLDFRLPDRQLAYLPPGGLDHYWQWDGHRRLSITGLEPSEPADAGSPFDKPPPDVRWTWVASDATAPWRVVTTGAGALSPRSALLGGALDGAGLFGISGGWAIEMFVGDEHHAVRLRAREQRNVAVFPIRLDRHHLDLMFARQPMAGDDRWVRLNRRTNKLVQTSAGGFAPTVSPAADRLVHMTPTGWVCIDLPLDDGG